MLEELAECMWLLGATDVSQLNGYYFAWRK